MIDREKYENMDEKEQAKTFYLSSAADKGELLMRSHAPDRLIQSLSEEELFLVLQETDPEERGEIIKYANIQQLYFVSDIECWNKDRMNFDGFLKWLETLQQADEKRLLAWLIYADYEVVVAGLKGLIIVTKPDWEYASDELLGDRPHFSFDERYYLYVKEENLETLKRAMELLFENHRGRYAAILEGIIGDLDDVIEEEAYRKREDRLADLGFPDTESANKIYSRISEEDFHKLAKKDVHKDLKDNVLRRKNRPNYLALWTGESLFLDKVLILLKEDPPEFFDGIQEELVWLSNKVIACEGINFSSEEQVQQGIERARYLTSIGLEVLSQGDMEQARILLKDQWLEYILRIGVSRLFDLRDKARTIVRNYWESSTGEFIEFLNRPYEFILKGALNRIPQHHDLTLQKEVESLTDFKELRQVEMAECSISQIHRIHEILEKKFPKFFHKRLKTNLGDHPQTLYSYLATLFTHWHLDGKASVKGLSEKNAAKFLESAFDQDGKRRRLKNEIKNEFLSKILDEEDRKLLLPLWGFVFQELEEELGAIEKVDRRYISMLIFEEYSLK